MTNDLDRKILDCVAAKPGQQAKEIASQLGVDRRQVNAALYGRLKSRVQSDANYRWSPRDLSAMGTRESLGAAEQTRSQGGSPVGVQIASPRPNFGRQFVRVNDNPSEDNSSNITPRKEGIDTNRPKIQPSAFRAYPVNVAAAPRHRHSQSTFVQSCGLPPAYVDHLYMADADRSLVRAAVQWRLDFPLPHNDGVLPDDRNVLAIAEALLTRGATPFCSHELEAALEADAVRFEAIEPVLDAIRRVALAPSCRFHPLTFDSAEERAMFDWVQAFVEREGLPWVLIPQIQLASLSSAIDPSAGERGDLLLTHPEGTPILIEIDGMLHEAHRDRDHGRDRALEEAGVRVIRVQAGEVRSAHGPTLDHLKQMLLDGRAELPHESDLSRAFRWYKFLHQIQLALLAALRGGWLRFDAPWNVGVSLLPTLRGDSRANKLIVLAVTELVELLSRLARLHDRHLSPPQLHVSLVTEGDLGEGLNVLIGPADGSVDNLSFAREARFLVSDVCFPGEIQAPHTAASPARLTDPQREDVRWFLQYLFRKNDFLEGQWETIERTLRGLDSVVLLPTGGGKSISFQLAALLLPGRCLVVDPIISLIDDQIDNLARLGIDRCIGITSQLSTNKRELAIQGFKSGHYLFCYVAPERFQTVPFRQALRTLTTNTPISLIAIDEAHCVSEWGHDFRTAYLNLGRITREYCTSQNLVPPLVALTGTASRIVLKDVQRELGVTSFEAIITPKTFDRPELRFSILTCRSDEKMDRVLGFMERLPTDFAVDRSCFFMPAGKNTYAGLVFCPHVNGPFGVTQQADHLQGAFRTHVAVYCGKAPLNKNCATWEQEKQKVARDFKRNRVPVLACTSAFGMGIDKPNVRYTVHIGLPSSIESFYQEAGRAGRDRRRAECAIILSNDDPRRSQRILGPATTLEEVTRVINETGKNDSDDIVRALWFHVRAFRGERAEVEDIGRMLDDLGDVRTRRVMNITWRSQRWSSQGDKQDSAQERSEKALHRLVVLGVVEDYTVNYASKEFGVRISGAMQEEIAAEFGRYAGAYQTRLGEQAEDDALALRKESHREYLLAVAERLIAFIYQHIELARRRALSEMLQAVGSARNGDDLRHRVLEYLGQSEWDERLEAVRSSARGGVDCLAPILDDLVSPNDAAALRAATGRSLSSYPDVPGLLILRSVAEALSLDADPDVVQQNVEAAQRFAAEKFRLDSSEVAAALSQAISRARNKAGAGELILQSILASSYANRVFVRALLHSLPRDIASIPSMWLVNQVVEQCTVLTN